MKMRLFLCILLIPLFCGCAAYKPAPEIVKALELLQSASEDISTHNLELSRERIGEYIADLREEQAKESPDRDKIRDIREKIALEEENIAGLKELPLALLDLHAWAKGEE